MSFSWFCRAAAHILCQSYGTRTHKLNVQNSTFQHKAMQVRDSDLEETSPKPLSETSASAIHVLIPPEIEFLNIIALSLQGVQVPRIFLAHLEKSHFHSQEFYKICRNGSVLGQFWQFIILIMVKYYMSHFKSKISSAGLNCKIFRTWIWHYTKSSP